MMFVAYLFFFLVYLGFSVFVVRKVVAAARRRGRNGWKWGLPAALVMYLVPFWDHVPTLVIHKYLCATEAGLWVYEAPEIWKKNNLNVNDALVRKEKNSSLRESDTVSRYKLNEFFLYENRVNKFPIFPVWIDSAMIVDAATLEVVARQTNVTSGYAESNLKKWVGSKPCFFGAKKFGQLMEEFGRIGR